MRDIDYSKGLSSVDARAILAKRKSRHKSKILIFIKIIFEQTRSMFFYLLIIGGLLSYNLGEHTDAYIFWGICLINVLLGSIQDFRATLSGNNIAAMISSHTHVIRDGNIIKIKSGEVVTGDYIILRAGDVVCADVQVDKAENSYIDESARTGESAPRLIELKDTIYAGTTISGGTVYGIVTKDPASSTLNEYSNKLNKITKQITFEAELGRLGLIILIITVIALTATGVIGILIIHSFTLLSFLLFAVALIAGVVPEALPLITTLIASNTSSRLSKDGVITKRLSSIQELGSMRYLVTDKTGTLTQNILTVHYASDSVNDIAQIFSATNYPRDGMDELFETALSKHYNFNQNNLQTCDSFTPYDPKLGYSSITLNNTVYIKGQYQKILNLCGETNNTDQASLEDQGMRVIAFAKLQDNIYTYQGFVAFEDPIKDDADDILRACNKLGVKLKILTGDTLKVAEYIAQKIGLNESTKPIDLSLTSIKELSDNDLNNITIFAKAKPEDKLELIKRLQNLGGVGFMGDGVNDALALRQANVGLAVNNSSDVARQAADLVLTEQSLLPVIKAIKLARGMYSHIHSYLVITLVGNIGTLFSLTILSLITKELPLQPTQILLVNALTDIPLVFLLTDTITKNNITKLPHFSVKEIVTSVFSYAIISSFFDFIFFGLFWNRSNTDLGTGWFLFSVTAELIVVLTLRRKKLFSIKDLPSRPLSIALIITVLFAALISLLPITRNIFGFSLLNCSDYIVIVGLILAYFSTNELIKKLLKS
jgi:P-type Mg2+ transporter